MITVTINGEKNKKIAEDTTYYEISKSVELENPVLGVKINNEVVPMGNTAKDGESLTFFDMTDTDGYKMYKSGVKMMFELAVKRVLTDAEVTFDHSVPNGMLGTVICNTILKTEHVEELKSAMEEIANDNILFKKLNVRNKESIQYYNKIRQYEKAENVNSISDQTNTLYQLDSVLNYYYSDMPYSTSAVRGFELIYLGNNKIVFSWTRKDSSGNVHGYIHNDKTIAAYDNAKGWLKILKVPYVADLNKIIESSKIKDFINSAEISFNMSISKVADAIVADKNKKFVLIAGPSSSGKTTSCKRLAEYLSAMGYNPIRISTDDYYVNREDAPRDEKGNYDFECLEAIDVQKLNDDIVKLLNHEKVKLPIYNFLTGQREESDTAIELTDRSIILMEGLHCLNNKLLPQIDEDYKYKIYLSPFMPINIDRHNYISSIDVRLIRRIVRDNRDRGAKVTNTMKSWHSVRYGEEKYIFPFISEADVVINTALAYEIGVLKVYAEPLLHSVGIDSPYYEEAHRLLNFLKPFFPIPGDYVNSTSILREFIGGRNSD